MPRGDRQVVGMLAVLRKRDGSGFVVRLRPPWGGEPFELDVDASDMTESLEAAAQALLTWALGSPPPGDERPPVDPGTDPDAAPLASSVLGVDHLSDSDKWGAN